MEQSGISATYVHPNGWRSLKVLTSTIHADMPSAEATIRLAGIGLSGNPEQIVIYADKANLKGLKREIISALRRMA